MRTEKNCPSSEFASPEFTIVASPCHPCLGRKKTSFQSSVNDSTPKKKRSPRMAFSLTELLITLLIVGLLLAAMAPVMTKKNRETLGIKGRSNYAVLSYGDVYCPAVSNDVLDGGNASCSGNFLVPDGVTEITVTVVGAGGGGGAGNVSGYAEYTTPGTSSFTVPYGSTDINATLISGGGGGGAGGAVLNSMTFVTSGTGNETDANKRIVNSTGTGAWTVPNAAKNANILVTGCGGGGGGGGGYQALSYSTNAPGNGGGSGGYKTNQIINLNSINSLTYYIGGGGHGGGVGGGPTEGQTGLAYGGANHSCTADTVARCRAAGGSPDGQPAGSTLPSPGGAGGVGTYNGECGYSGATYVCRYSGGGGGATQAGGSGADGDIADCTSGSGGGGGGATQLVNGATILFNAPGGGGGSGNARNQHSACRGGDRAAGGGGGGTGGGNGGGSGQAEGLGGLGGSSGIEIAGGTVSNLFGSSYCGGGSARPVSEFISSYYGPGRTGYSGSSGAMKITYLDYGPGGSGGGAGIVVPRQNVKTTPGETLAVYVGTGWSGRPAGKINSDGTITSDVQKAYYDYLAEHWTTLARDGTNIKEARNRWGVSDGGVISGVSSGVVNTVTNWGVCNPGTSGSLGDGTPSTSFVIFAHARTAISGASYTQNGFTWKITNALTANNTLNYAQTTTPTSSCEPFPTSFPNGSTGGAGGTITTPWFTCTPGVGGTLSSPKGGKGERGCGGGGGYGLADGGDGGDGYARLEYNPANIGSGGGGGAGLGIKKIKMSVTSREVIPYTIGAGGIGGKIVGTIPTPSKQGGTTTFNTGSKLIQAGGGFGGGNVSVSSNTIINGAAGVNASICTVVGTTSTLCKTGANLATSGSNSKGGNGADSLDTKGAIGGDVNEDLTLKKSGAGSGGAGASVYTNQATQSPKYLQGGTGGHGMIIVEWK